METIQVIAVGKLGDAYLRQGCEEYSKRLGTMVKLQITEVGEYRLPDSPSAGEIERCLRIEGKAILEKAARNSYCIAMCIEGKQMSSQQLAALLGEVKLSGKSNIVLIIGGSHGLSPEVKQRAELKLSISPMTFPHQLTRLILLEQIYRVCSINQNGKYHK